MSDVSRRTLLGYSGTTAAGAVLGATTAAQPARAAEPATATVEFSPGTQFTGAATIGDIDATLRIKFSVDTEQAPAGAGVTALELATLLSDFAVSKGWPPITFYGTPPPVALN
ncbi:twin-arginine translocation signal domain-containing protein [Streptomyces sp. 4F14]|uniref:twin-arginine translocation signal domain-containing protein n=1 Tax=Streptomyces sp. 4F14 TaxID=3394380 RepID=UPI003A84F9A9